MGNQRGVNRSPGVDKKVALFAIQPFRANGDEGHAELVEEVTGEVKEANKQTGVKLEARIAY